MKFSRSIINLFIFGIAAVISSFAIIFLSNVSFAEDFEVVTGTPFTQKMPVLILFLSGILSVYIAVIKLWRNLDLKSNAIFLAFCSLILLVSVSALLYWLSSVYNEVNVSYNRISFPSDVDQITTNVQLSLIKAVSFMFGVFGIIGLASFIVSLMHMRSLSKHE